MQKPLLSAPCFAKKSIPHEALVLDTELQAVAVKVSLHKSINMCNLPPCSNVAQLVDRLVNQLPVFIIFWRF